MFLEEETFERFGYYPSQLSQGSGKRILAQCDGCGKVRELKKQDYHALCPSCAKKGEKNHNYGKHFSEEHKKKMGEARKGEKNPLFGKHHSEEHKRKIREALKGENNHQWKGGISFEPYCPKWNEDLKEHIRDKFGRTCFLCPTTEEENGQKLSAHHVNYDKNCLCDDSVCQFVPLCMSCHSKTNNNRAYWEMRINKKLKTLIIGYYV